MKFDVDAARGLICLVTGGTSGIGFATAKNLAEMGAEILIVGRETPRGPEAVQKIQDHSRNPRVHFLAADLSHQSQVRNLAQRIAVRFSRLDVLVNNAGGYFLGRRLSADGIEMTWALNHLGVFLLTCLLLDLLSAGPSSRIVNVSSSTHRGARIAFDDLQGEVRYNGWRAYGQSKLANVFFTYELARRLRGRGVTANALHPGFVGTRLAHENGILVRQVMRLARLFARTPAQGAQTSVYLAASPDVEGINGSFFEDCRAVQSDPVSYDEAVASRLWEVSEMMTGVHFLSGSSPSA